MLGYALRSLKKPYRIAAILLSILLWYGLSSMVFEIQIKGEKDESRKLIADTLKKMEVVPPFKLSLIHIFQSCIAGICMMQAD